LLDSIVYGWNAFPNLCDAGGLAIAVDRIKEEVDLAVEDLKKSGRADEIRASIPMPAAGKLIRSKIQGQ
jgi:hypothetical protein